MNKKEKRQNMIIRIMSEVKNIQISDLSLQLQKYEIKVDDRTILRDISDLINQKRITKQGVGKSTFYYLTPINRVFEDIEIEEYFSQDYQQRDIQEGFNFEIFDILADDIFTDEEKEILENLQRQFVSNISKYESQTLINKEYERIMIEFSWKSSEIEGNTYSLLNTEVLIKENIADTTKSKEETTMILNHKDAFNESIQNRSRFLSLKYNDIEYIHAILTKQLGITKNIRKHGVGITGTKYRPLDNEFQIKEALEKMITLINQKEFFFEKAFLSIVLLSYIQAFEDGNKRTARMFSNAILLAHNSIPLSYRAVDAVEYKKAIILFYEENNISYFKQIFIKQLEDAVNNYFN